jgi:hypothetical protein
MTADPDFRWSTTTSVSASVCSRHFASAASRREASAGYDEALRLAQSKRYRRALIDLRMLTKMVCRCCGR